MTHDIRPLFRYSLLIALLGITLTASACLDAEGAAPSYEASYASVLPSPEDIELRVPADPNSNALMLGQTAQFYADTYNITRGVNGTIYGVLSALGDLVQLPPSEVGEDYAIWGPYTPALEPTTFVLVVRQVGETQYEYALQMRPRTSTSEDDFQTIIEGEADTGDEELEGRGRFFFDWTAYAELNPLAELEGRMWVDYEHRRLQWRSVEMLFEEHRERQNPDSEPTNVLYRYLEHADTSGEFQFAFLEDIHGGQDDRPGLELVQIRSRWSAGGAGRGDARIAGPEIAADLAEYAGLDQNYVQASECWDDQFLRIYYDESPVRLSDDDGDPPEGELNGPGQGDVGDCMYLDALFPDDDVTVL